MIPAAVLLSGGGNDVAGDEFRMLLNHARSPTPGLNDDVVRGIIEDRVQNAYVTIIAAVTKISRERTGSTIPIFIHGYDHAVPDGRGFADGWGPLPGPWFEPGFREKGFDDLDETTRLVADLIDRFNRMLRNVASTSGFGHVHYLDLRATLPNGPGYKTWWANEIPRPSAASPPSPISSPRQSHGTDSYSAGRTSGRHRATRVYLEGATLIPLP